MSKEPDPAQDESLVCFGHFERNVRREIRNLITDELVEEHRTTFGKRRSDPLERVLGYFHSGGVADKYAILSIIPFSEYRLISLSGRRGTEPAFVNDVIYSCEEEAQHALFVLRVSTLARERIAERTQ
jgi:branched-chain amino acid transport system permease protein